MIGKSDPFDDPRARRGALGRLLRTAFGLEVADRLDFDTFTLVYLRNPEADFEVELTDQQGPHGALRAGRRLRPYRASAWTTSTPSTPASRRAGLQSTQDRRIQPRRRAARPLLLRRGSRRLQDRGSAAARPISIAAARRASSADPASQARLRRDSKQGRKKWSLSTNRKPGPLAARALEARHGRGALLVVSGSAVLSTDRGLGRSRPPALKPETMATLIQMARDIYPHDQVPDKFYAIAVKSA